jgi:hypothetical protein
VKASEFIAEIERRHGVTLALHRGRLHVLGGALSRGARQAIASQRDSLIAYLAHDEDGDLRVPDPERFGLVKLEHGGYAHPDGDHMIAEILLDPERAAADARERQAQRDREAYALGASRPALPREQALDIRPGRYPGHFTFTLKRGRRYR